MGNAHAMARGSSNLVALLERCRCGCGCVITLGRSYASRTCANRVAGLARVGTAKRKAWLEKCGKGRAVETDRFAARF